MIREIGARDDGTMISLWQGRWGLYITDGKTNFNLRDEDPETVDVAKALVFLAKAAEERAGRLVGVNPDTKAEIRVMRGPYGHYLTDGAINASLPRGLEPDEVDLPFALVRMVEYGKPVKAKKGAGKRKTAAESGTKATTKPKAEAKTKAEPKAKAAAKPKAASKAKAAAKPKVQPKAGLAALPKAPIVEPPAAPLPPSRSGTRRPAGNRGADA